VRPRLRLTVKPSAGEGDQACEESRQPIVPVKNPPPSLRRAIITSLAIAAIAASAALPGGGISDALVTLAVFGLVNLAFLGAWSAGQTKPVRKVRFTTAWASMAGAIAIVLFVVLALRSSLHHAITTALPVIGLIAAWVILQRWLVARQKWCVSSAAMLSRAPGPGECMMGALSARDARNASGGASSS